jgi:uncharacterized protein (TIGR02996 family)
MPPHSAPPTEAGFRGIYGSSAFLDAIAKEPADVFLRLVFADWLEEKGEAERAEFIRVQCELARLGPHDPARYRLESRERELLRKHWRGWLGGLRRSLKRWRFRLGLLEEVTVTAACFLFHADTLFQLGPVRAVEFHDASRRTAALAACPHLARLDTITLSYNFLTDAAARDLAGSPHLAGLGVLRLAHNFIRAAGAEALAAAPGLAGLRLLDLTANPLGGNASREILRARFQDRLIN